MRLILFTLLQTQSTKSGWFVWTLAILLFLTGLGLLVYLMTRPKLAQDDELEDDRRGGLLAASEAAEKRAAEEEFAEDAALPVHADAPVAADEAFHLAETKPLFDDESPTAAPTSAAGETIPFATAADDFQELRTLVTTPEPPRTAEMPAAEIAADVAPPTLSETIEEAPPETLPLTASPWASVEAPPVEEDFIPPPVQQEVTLEDVAAPSLAPPFEPPTPETIEEPSPLPLTQSAPLPPTPDAGSTRTLSSEFTPPSTPSPEAEAETQPIHASPAESLMQEARSEIQAMQTEEAAPAESEARLDDYVAPARFEQPAPPASGRSHREPFESPRIQPLAPKAKPSPQTSVLASPPPLSEVRPAPPPTSGDAPRQTRTFGVEQAPPTTMPTTRQTTTPTPTTPAPAESVWASASAPQTGATTPAVGRKSGGAILGLPTERSNAPLVLGEPVLSADEIGVTGLSHYGTEPRDTDTGRGGLLTLLIVIVVLGGLAGAYFGIPAFKERANRLLGRGDSTVAPAEKPKAQVIPSRAMDYNKNIVKARGAVTNISEETLEELAVEITFVRGENTVIETRIVPVTPNLLAPQQQGQYEFEYDGNRATGFSRYRVSKLLSKAGEVKFSTPNQQ